MTDKTEPAPPGATEAKRLLLATLLRDRIKQREQAPLSREQQRFFLLHQLDPSNPELYVTASVHLSGPLQEPALRCALDEVLRRHAALRATFAAEGASLSQHFHPFEKVDALRVIDLSQDHADAQLQRRDALLNDEANIRTPFDIARGPLFAYTLIRLSADRHELIARFHHLISDLWSTQLWLKELFALYGTFERGTQPVLHSPRFHYADYVRAEADEIARAAHERAWWKSQLAGAPAYLALSGAAPRPAVHTTRADSVQVELSSTLYAQVVELGRTLGATPYMVFLAAYQALLFRFSDQQDILVGSAVAARDNPDFDDLLGLFVRWIVIRSKIDPAASFGTFLTSVAACARETYQRPHVPVSELIALHPAPTRRDPSRTPLFQVTFQLVHHQRPVTEGKLTVDAVEMIKWPRMHFDLSLVVERTDSGPASATFLYYADLFDSTTMQAFASAYRALLAEIVASPETLLSALKVPDGWPRRASAPTTAPLNIAIAAGFVAEPISDSLDYWSRALELPIRVEFAPYDQVFQQLLDPHSVLGRNAAGVNVVWLRLEGWSDPEAILSEFAAALRAATERGPQTWLIVVGPAPDGAQAQRQAQWAQLSSRLANLPGVHLLLPDQVLSRYPVSQPHDPAAWEHGRVPYSTECFAAFGTAIMRTVRALRSRQIKVIVLDCDQTLWGGVCGEDGPQGVKLTPPRRALQEFMVRQHDSGVLLCLCSKNNEADVAEVFARPDMVLRDEHIVASRINWKPKSRNLRSLAQELNLGLDSFLFLDDSAVECAEVEAGCPEVMVAQLPADEASIEPFLQHHWAFDRTAVTEEDRRRTQMYRQEAERARSLQKAPSLQEFLEKLELVVTIAELEDSDLERAAQLTNRTNQFNLTTVRRTPGEITSFLAGGGEARIVRVRDRFGDYGVVGLLLFEAQKAVRVDTFLLSCRVLGRGVEYEVTRALGRLAAARGRSHLEFPFRRTKKNSPALEFLEALPAERDAGVNDAVFRLEATAAQVVRASLLSEPLGADEVPRAKGDSAPVANGVILARIASQGGDIGRIRAQIAADLSHAPGVRSAAFVAPRSATEEKLAEIWRSVLHVSEVGVDDDFFELGGDSMQAVQIVSSAIAVGLSLEIDVALEHSTIARQAAWLESRPAARALTPIDTSSLSVPIPHRTQRMEDVYPLSFMQRFMLDQYRHANEERQPASGAYHYQQTIRFIDRRPPISLDAFREALIETARRRPMMRVAIVENEAGERVQAIERERWPVIGVTDLSHFREDEQTAAIDRAMRADRATPFDTRPGHAPLIRVSLFRRTNEQFECFFSCHHAIGDGWGAQQAFNEILQRYDELRRRAAPPVSAGPDSYKEFVALERERVRSPEARAFWSRHLAAREEAAPSWQPRESQPPGEPVDRRLAKDLFARVSSLTQRLHVSAKAVLLAPYLQLLGEWFGGKTVTVGVVAGNRSERLSDPLGAFGLFWSFMPFCTRLDEAAARPVHRSLLEAERFSDYPLAQIQSDLGVPELFWATFNFVHFHNATWANSTTDLEPRGMTLFDKFHFPLNWKVAIDPGSGAIDVTCTHDERLISSEKSRALLERYETLLVQSLTSQGAER